MATYSSSRIGTGPFLFVSGQTPSDSDGRVPGDPGDQTRLVLGKIRAELAEHRREWDSVVKLTYYLREISDLAAVREAILAEIPEPRPAATLVEVGAFIDPEFRVEIDAIADLGA